MLTEPVSGFSENWPAPPKGGQDPVRGLLYLTSTFGGAGSMVLAILFGEITGALLVLCISMALNLVVTLRMEMD